MVLCSKITLPHSESVCMVLLGIVIQLNLKCKVVDDTSNSTATVGLCSSQKTVNLLSDLCAFQLSLDNSRQRMVY